MRRRWVLGAISGFFFGLSLSVILVGLRVVHLDSALLTLLPAIGLVLGLLLGLWGPRERRRVKVATVPRAPGSGVFPDTVTNVPPPPSGDPIPPPAAPPVLAQPPEPAAPEPPAAAPELPPEPPAEQ